MLIRLLCGGIIVFWTASTAWLIHHDVMPALLARDVPRYALTDWTGERTRLTQARIEDKTGRRVGTIWTVYTATEVGLSRHDVFWIENFSSLPELRIEAESDFTREGRLDTLRLRLFGAGERIELEAEDFSGSLAFRLLIGPRSEQLFKVDASAAGMIGDVFRPFPVLPNLEVGQSWRMHVVNPLAAVMGVGSKLIPMIVKVKSRERLMTDEGPVECFLVETDRGARAWVDDAGNVLRQEVETPIGGRLSVVAEAFDEEKMTEVLALPLPSGVQPAGMP